MPLLTVVTDESGGYVYVLSPKHDRLPDRARELIKYPQPLAAQYGEAYPGLPCAAWRVEWPKAAELKATLEHHGYATNARPITDYAPHGPSVLECPDCHTARRATSQRCECGSTEPPTTPPPLPTEYGPAPPGWRDCLRDCLAETDDERQPRNAARSSP